MAVRPSAPSPSPAGSRRSPRAALTVGVHHITATYNPTVPGPYATSQGTGDVTITAAPLVSIAVAPNPVTLKVGAGAAVHRDRLLRR